MYGTWLKLPEAVASYLSTYLYENLWYRCSEHHSQQICDFKSSQMQKELNAVFLSVQYRARGQPQLSIREKCADLRRAHYCGRKTEGFLPIASLAGQMFARSAKWPPFKSVQVNVVLPQVTPAVAT